MNIGIICKYPIPYGMAATTRIFSYSKGLLECGDKVDVWSIAPNNFNANNNNEGVFNGISYFYSFRSKRFSNKLFHAYEMIYSLFILGVKLHIWGIERSGFFNGREKWAKGFENQRV